MMKNETMEEVVETPRKKKPGRPPKPAELALGLESKCGLWKIAEQRGDEWIVVPTEKHVRAFGRVPMLEPQLRELFQI